MAGSSHGGESGSLVSAFAERAWYVVDHAFLIHMGHMMAAFAGVAVYAAVHKFFKSGVDSQTVIECETYLEPTGEENKETKKEYINQVIHTHSTYNLRQVFAEATFNPNMLIGIVKRAADFCTNEDIIVWSHLHKAMQKDSFVYQHLPERIAEKFGHYSEDRRKAIINEMARCVRNYRSEQLTPDHIRTTELKDREAFVWRADMSVLIFQKGAGANVFTSLKIPADLLDCELPDKENTRFVYYDPNKPVIDFDSHLHDRVTAIRAIQNAIKKDIANDNPIIDKFFTRFTTGEKRKVPSLKLVVGS